MYRLTPTGHCQDAGSQPSSRDSSADVLRLAKEREGPLFPRSLQCLGIGRGSPSHKPWAGVGWPGLLERISGSSWWAGWQWLSLMPAGPREALTWHKGSGSTTRPLSMNQLNHSTEKLTQTHRRPLGGTCLGLRLQGTVILTPALGDKLQALPGEPLSYFLSASPHISSVGEPSHRANGVCLVCASWIYLLSFNCTLRMFKFWLGQNGAQMTSTGTLPSRNLRLHRARRGRVRFLEK